MFKSYKKLLIILLSSLFLVVHSGFLGIAEALADPITARNSNLSTVILVSDLALLNDVGQLFDNMNIASPNMIKSSQTFIQEQIQHGSELSQKVTDLTKKQLENAGRLSTEAKSLLNQINVSQIITNASGSIEGNVALSKQAMQDLSNFVGSGQFIETTKNVLEQQNIAKDRVIQETAQLLSAKAELGKQILANTQTTLGNTLISSNQILKDAAKISGDKLLYSQQLVQDFGNNLQTIDFADISNKTNSFIANINIPVNQLVLDSISFAGEQVLGKNKQLRKDMKVFLQSTPETMCQAYLDSSQGVDSSSWMAIQEGAGATWVLLQSITTASAAGAGALSGYAGMASTVSQLGLGGLTQLIAGWLGSSASGAAATAVVTSAVGGPAVMGLLLVGGTGAVAYGGYQVSKIVTGKLQEWAKANCK
ncbi:hypothetical protein [Planktothrix sp.]|uniref:hypothetical protein n=1 Tax=Planktothrix sp. TaxID=3088171 RepID=UPI0038D50D46